jgi:biopolymer transport protein ExbD
VTREMLPALLRAELTRAADGGEPFRVVVRADRRQRFGRLDEVFRLCRRAGLGRVIFRARQESEP